jgi:hypothetical protein
LSMWQSGELVEEAARRLVLAEDPVVALRTFERG